MSEPTASPARICQLDDGYRREARALLYEVYRDEPNFAYLLQAQRPGYERRLRAVVRERVRQHFFMQLPALGLLVDDRLVGVALIVPPQRRLGVTDSWAWRLRMVLGAGLGATRRYLAYQAALESCLPTDRVHVLPMLGIDPRLRGQQHGERLLQAVHDWCAEDPHTQGVVLDSGNEEYLAFYQRQGYEEIGEVALGPIRERVFFHPTPAPCVTAVA